MTVVLPDDAATITPEDTTSLRWSARTKDGAGFIFLNNYQDHVEMQPISGITFALQTGDETLTFPQGEPLTLKPNVSAILPFNLSLSGIHLHYATTQLFARIGDDYFFFAPDGMRSEYGLNSAIYTVEPGLDSAISLTNPAGEPVRFITLPRDYAERAARQPVWGRERLMISEGTPIERGGESFLFSALPNRELLVYPPVEGAVRNGLFSRHAVGVPAQPIRLQIEQLDAARALVRLPPNLLDGMNDLFLRVEYVGDIGNCFINRRAGRRRFLQRRRVGDRPQAVRRSGGGSRVVDPDHADQAERGRAQADPDRDGFPPRRQRARRRRNPQPHHQVGVSNRAVISQHTSRW